MRTVERDRKEGNEEAILAKNWVRR